jgi:hypothetical protein
MSDSVGTSIQPPPGVDLVDKIAVAFDQRERAQAAAPDTMAQMVQVMMTMQATQTQMLQALTTIVMRMEEREALPKKAPPLKDSS